ncbi:hypothetical protein Bbelb_006310 [Branchiostoma belcheri]|nr:hypothetical protein Bbelb_006310 [Branchiostoma belcheri]
MITNSPSRVAAWCAGLWTGPTGRFIRPALGAGIHQHLGRNIFITGLPSRARAGTTSLTSSPDPFTYIVRSVGNRVGVALRPKPAVDQPNQKKSTITTTEK